MTYRILSLDGGGAWSLIQVRALIELYGGTATGHQVLQNFDLAAANSGGSLVLAGLVEDLPLAAVLQYFMDEQKRRSLFPPPTMVGDEVLHQLLGVGPKYSATAKLPAIERLLPRTGDRPLAGAVNGVVGPGGAPVHVLVVGFDYDRNRAVFFRSAAAGKPGWGDGTAADVSLAGRYMLRPMLQSTTMMRRPHHRVQQPCGCRRRRGTGARPIGAGDQAPQPRHGERLSPPCAAWRARLPVGGAAAEFLAHHRSAEARDRNSG
jgi:hypothetical protein